MIIISLCLSPQQRYNGSIKPPLHDFFELSNRVFVKFGWLISFVPPIALHCMLTAMVVAKRGNGNMARIDGKFIVRCVCYFLYWAFMTQKFMVNYFDIIASRYGTCSNSYFEDRKNCTFNGHSWSSVDVSGHAFLIILNSLFIMEETVLFFKKCKKAEGRRLKFLYIYGSIIAFFEVLLVVFYNVQLVRTVVYYHTFIENSIAIMYGAFPWIIFYLL